MTISSNVITAVLLTSALAISPATHAFAQSNPDTQLQADVMKALDKKQFSGVHAEVNSGAVKLTGSVATYADKEDADRRAHHRKGVTAVDNELQVAVGSEVDDATLTKKLVEKLEYDRVGYGTTAFNAISVSVHDGVVTLAGNAYGPTDKDSAVSLVAHYAGVKDLIDDINVEPLSPNDDRIRIEAYRSIYGFPSLNKYAIDPGKPIRIVVVNGNITLAGVVDTQADKDTANIRANSVSGAFKVTNLLRVANEKEAKR